MTDSVYNAITNCCGDFANYVVEDQIILVPIEGTHIVINGAVEYNNYFQYLMHLPHCNKCEGDCMPELTSDMITTVVYSWDKNYVYYYTLVPKDFLEARELINFVTNAPNSQELNSVLTQSNLSYKDYESCYRVRNVSPDGETMEYLFFETDNQFNFLQYMPTDDYTYEFTTDMCEMSGCMIYKK